MNAYQIIELIRTTSGTNDKREILREHKDNLELQRLLTMTLDPRITFGVKKIPAFELKSESLTLNEAMDELGKLQRREVTGKNAIALLTEILESVSEENAEVIKWIISKDFKAGFGETLVNDEMGDFSVYTVPYMGATSYSPKRIKDIMKRGKAFSEVKMDGRYLNIICDNDDVFMESRGGKPNPLMGCLETEAKNLASTLIYPRVVFNGELMFKGEKDRYIANGIIASFVSMAQKEYDGVDITKEVAKFEKRWNMTLDEAKSRISYVCWDFIPLSNYKEKLWNFPRSNRLSLLKDAISASESFELVEYKIVKTEAEAIEHFQEMLARGEEGTILKASNGIWEDKKPVYQCKMKLEMNVDLRVVGFNYGTPGTKNENVISSLNVESMCSKLTTSPGGIKESDMQYITENMDSLMGSIVEVKSSGVSKDSEGNYSLLHPVFLKFRDDKNTGDTLESIIEIDAMAKGLTK